MEKAMSQMNQNLVRNPSSTISPAKTTASGIRTGKARKKRTVYTREQLNVLNVAFMKNMYPGIQEREYLSQIIGVLESTIQVWFQNARSRNSKNGNHQQTKKVLKNVTNNYQLPQTTHVGQEDGLNYMVYPGPSHASNICDYNAMNSQDPLSSSGIDYQEIHAPPNNQAEFTVLHQPCSHVPIDMNTQGTSGSASASFDENAVEPAEEINETCSLQMLLEYAQSIPFTDNCHGALEDFLGL